MLGYSAPLTHEGHAHATQLLALLAVRERDPKHKLHRHELFEVIHERFVLEFNRYNQVCSARSVDMFRMMLKLKTFMHYGATETPCRTMRV